MEMGDDWSQSSFVAMETCGCSLLCPLTPTAWSPALRCQALFHEGCGLNVAVLLNSPQSKKETTEVKCQCLKKTFLFVPADGRLWLCKPRSAFPSFLPIYL